MVSLERMSRIIDILSKRKIIATAQLEELLYCSTSTLRRDLIELEKEGKIIRSHGEVMLITANNVEYVYSARAREEEKASSKLLKLLQLLSLITSLFSLIALRLQPCSFRIWHLSRTYVS